MRTCVSRLASCYTHSEYGWQSTTGYPLIALAQGRMMSAANRFATEVRNDVTVIALLDARLFNSLIVSELQDDLVEFLETEQPRKVLVNFEAVTQCSTSVINAMLRAKKRVTAQQGQLKLCCMAGTIRDAYRMLNLEGTVFEIYDSADEALRSY